MPTTTQEFVSTRPVPSADGKYVLTERAVFARVARVLKRKGMGIRRCRHSSRAARDLGRYFTLDTAQTGNILGTHIDLEALARSEGVLGTFEAMEQAPTATA